MQKLTIMSFVLLLFVVSCSSNTNVKLYEDNGNSAWGPEETKILVLNDCKISEGYDLEDLTHELHLMSESEEVIRREITTTDVPATSKIIKDTCRKDEDISCSSFDINYDQKRVVLNLINNGNMNYKIINLTSYKTSYGIENPQTEPLCTKTYS